MKIAFVYDAVYPYKIGGVEKRIWELSRRLAAGGHDVHIFGMKLWDGPSSFLREGVNYHGVCRKMPFYAGDAGARRIFPVLWFSISLVFPLLRKGRYDVIDCQNFPYLPCLSVKLVSLMQGSTLIITWHEVWDDYWLGYIGRKGIAGKFIEKMIAGFRAIPVAVSETTRAKLERIGVKRSILLIPNGIDIENIRSIPPSNKHSDLIFVGRLIRDKHVDILIDSVKILQPDFPDLRCLVVGQGPEEERLKNQVFTLHLDQNITFLDFASDHDDTISLMKASKICVLPSTREGFGIVALEALACGIPVVTANHPGNAIRDLTPIGGVYVVPLKREDFAKAINDRLSSPFLLVYGIQVDEWDWDEIAKRWFQSIGRIVANKTR